MKKEEVCTATIKLTEQEIDKLIWCMKAIQRVLGVFEIKPDKDWLITLDIILKDMEKISQKILDKKEQRTNDKKEPTANPKKEYINKITGKEGIKE